MSELLTRTNGRGMTYHITELPNQAYGHKTIISLVGTDKSIIVDVPLDTINRGWYHWIVQGKFVQDAFPFLNPDQREFIMTGITLDEWNEIFKEDEDTDA